MKKTIKIIAFFLLLALAIWCGIVMINRIVDALRYISYLSTAAVSAGSAKTIIRNLIAGILPHFCVFVLLLLNAFFILFDFYFQEPMFKFQAKIKANREAKREQAKQKRYDKLKSKIEKMESDE